MVLYSVFIHALQPEATDDGMVIHAAHSYPNVFDPFLFLFLSPQHRNRVPFSVLGGDLAVAPGSGTSGRNCDQIDCKASARICVVGVTVTETCILSVDSKDPGPRHAHELYVLI